jgi:heme-degrading monooxygenase HmoA
VFVTAWEFQTRPEVAARFAAAYGPDGEWVRLLRNAPGYIGSEALQDRDDPHRFLVMDRWRDEESFRAFRKREAIVYEDLDRRCLEATEKELRLGHFTTWDGTVPGAAPTPP